MGYETSLQLFIDGVWKSGEGRDAHPVVNPVDASPIAEVPYATKADLDDALAASERAWPEWRATDVEKRGAILHKAAALLRERVDLIAATMTQEQGKVLPESKAETLASAQLFDWYAEEAKRDYGRTLVRPAGQVSRVIRQPVGPTATFTPWNFPIYLLAKKVSAALASAPRSPPAAPSSRGRRTRPPAAAPSCSARSPTPASPTASPSSSTATAA
jgi:succinate-semialdehyde dehydrogenase / glutarate-semialdehyde dehydrogenase